MSPEFSCVPSSSSLSVPSLEFKDPIELSCPRYQPVELRSKPTYNVVEEGLRVPDTRASVEGGDRTPLDNARKSG